METARRAASIGYSALVLPDHLLGQFAPVPVLATVELRERFGINSIMLDDVEGFVPVMGRLAGR